MPASAGLGSDPIHMVHGINMFMARWAFDLARSKAFEAAIKHRIQKKLHELRRPNYVNPLNVVSMDIGINFPVFKNMRALPAPSSVIWPQLLVDVYYEGGLELTIETTVDPRDMAAWNTLDKAITTLGGRDHKPTRKAEATEPTPGDLAEVSSASQNSSALGAASPGGLVQGTGSSKDGDIDNMELLSSSSTQGSSPAPESSRGRSGAFLAFRMGMAARAKQFAARMAESISKVPIRTRIRVSKLEGTMIVWVAPPPSRSLWVSFLGQPKLELRAQPVMMNRVIKNAVAVGRVSGWLERRLQLSFRKNFVFPNCHDLKFPGLLDPTKPDGVCPPKAAMLEELKGVEISKPEDKPPQRTSEAASGTSVSDEAPGPADKVSEAKPEAASSGKDENDDGVSNASKPGKDGVLEREGVADTDNRGTEPRE